MGLKIELVQETLKRLEEPMKYAMFFQDHLCSTDDDGEDRKNQLTDVWCEMEVINNWVESAFDDEGEEEENETNGWFQRKRIATFQKKVSPFAEEDNPMARQTSWEDVRRKLSLRESREARSSRGSSTLEQLERTERTENPGSEIEEGEVDQHARNRGRHHTAASGFTNSSSQSLQSGPDISKALSIEDAQEDGSGTSDAKNRVYHPMLPCAID